jgi:hypothetical protein
MFDIKYIRDILDWHYLSLYCDCLWVVRTYWAGEILVYLVGDI